MLNSATKTQKFFIREVDSNYPYWRLKSPEENFAEAGFKSKEARKYIFNCLDDMAQVNVSSELEGGELLAEKADRKEFIDLLKRMLTLDQDKRISPGEALNHNFITLNHLIDYGHCSNVKQSVQTMEVCKRSRYSNRNYNSTTQCSSDALYNNNSNEHTTSANALINNSSSVTLAFNNLQNQLASAMPTQNFYQQISAAAAAPRSNHSNRNNLTAQFAARYLQTAIADQFQAAAALCVPSVLNGQQHAANLSNNSVNLNCQNLNSPAKQIVPMIQHSQQFQPSLLNSQYVYNFIVLIYFF